MGRHRIPQNPTGRRALVALATAGVALGAGAGTACAGSEPVVDVLRTHPTSLGEIDPQSGLHALKGTVGHVTGPVSDLRPNPLAGTGVDPLDNGVGTQVADFAPVSSQALTGPVTQARSIGSVPVVGEAAGLLNNG
ncbi:hypothetical protein [Streptomyces sp. HUAS ZL42]|uniref:hypothetical protein n=1 Tax=Streptomyces sp. HUAS ZL42 TaxID=3231715 RepID=UPI00345E5D6E